VEEWGTSIFMPVPALVAPTDPHRLANIPIPFFTGKTLICNDFYLHNCEILKFRNEKFVRF
jgi:hypothetical protein